MTVDKITVPQPDWERDFWQAEIDRRKLMKRLLASDNRRSTLTGWGPGWDPGTEGDMEADPKQGPISA